MEMLRINESRTYLLSRAEEEKFCSTYARIRDHLISSSKNELGSGVMEEVTSWMVKVLDGTVSKHASWGLLTPAAFESIKQLSHEETNVSRKISCQLQYIVGWMAELFWAAVLIPDRILNDRVKSAWHRNSDVGLKAVNDSFMLGSLQHIIIKSLIFPENEVIANKLKDVALEYNHLRGLGVALEEGLKKSSSKWGYSIQKYRDVIKYKFSYHVVYTPVKGAMILAGKDEDKMAMEMVEDIMLKVGYMINLRMERSKVFGSSRRDIETPCKISWFFVNAMSYLHEAQDTKKIQDLNDSVDSGDWEAVEKIYRDLDLESRLYHEENKLYEELVTVAFAVRDFINPAFFFKVLESFNY